MKYFYIFIAGLCLTSFQINAQDNYWLQRSGGSGNDEPFGISSFQNQIYTTGYYSDYSLFDNFQLAPYGGGDIFVSKQSPNGAYVWVKRFGGSLVDRGICITTLPNGNICVGGTVSGNVSFDQFQLSTNQGSQDIFVACLSPEGNVLWVKLFGGVGIDIISDIKADSENNIIFTGQFRGQIQIGTETFQSEINPTTQAPSYDIFLTKLNAQGTPIWTKHGKASRDDRSLNLAINPNNEIYLSGIFSDQLTFSNSYANNTNNIGFLMKFSSIGDEVWFRRIQSSVSTISGISCDAENVYLAGDFFGTQRFSLSASSNSWQSFNNTFTFKYYLASYKNNGDFNWCVTEGSVSETKCKGVAVLNSNRIALTGQFDCIHSTYNALYGEGLYISKGYSDVFISEYDANGQLKRSKQIGGTATDEVNCIISNNSGQAILSGSFEESIATPARPQWGNQPWYQSFGNAYTMDGSHCGDDYYNFYASVKSLGNKDVFIANIADSSRSTFDIFKRKGNECNVETYSGNIVSSNGGSVHCDNVTLVVNLPTGPADINGINYNYLWNGTQTNESFNLGFTDSTRVFLSAQNTCFSFSDTTFNEIIGSPPNPEITTSYGPIINSSPTLDCANKLVLEFGDQAILTGTMPLDGFESEWLLPDGSTVSGHEITINSGGVYEYFIRRNDGGCEKKECVMVLVFTPPPISNPNNSICENHDDPFIPLVLINPSQNDTVYGCPGANFQASLVDAYLHSQGLSTIINLFAEWSINGPANPVNTNLTISNHQKNYSITGTGNATITIKIFQSPGNTTVLQTVIKNFYIVEYPSPNIAYNVSGVYNSLCPGDTALFEIDSEAQITLPTENVFNVTENPASFQTIIPGTYVVNLFKEDEITGCTKTVSVSLQMNYKQAPTLEMNPSDGIVCPNDSVAISTIPASHIVWVGPTGDTLSNNTVLYASSPGYYYALVTDQSECIMVSNTVNVRQFTTPNYSVNPTKLCVGDSAMIEVDLIEGDSITWLSPLSGNAFKQVVQEPGIYQFQIISCGILSTVDVEVGSADVQAQISLDGEPKICSADTLKLLANEGNLLNYLWLPNEEIDSEISITQGGQYILEITDEFGCITLDTLNIEQLLSPNAPLPVDTILACSADTINIDLGEENVVFWLLGNTLVHSFSSVYDYVYDVNNSGLFIANYDSTNGCYSAKIEVPFNVKPPFILDSIADIVICEKQLFELSYSPLSSNASNYYWKDPLNNSIQDSILLIEEILISDEGNYAIIATGNQDYCGTDTSGFYIQVLPLPFASILTEPQYICTNRPFYAFSITDTSAISQWSYNAINYEGDTLIIALNNANPSELMLYLNVLSADGCNAKDSVNINIYQTPNIPQITPIEPICENDTIFLNLNLGTLDITQLNYTSNFSWNYANNQLFHYPALSDTSYFINASLQNDYCNSDSIYLEFSAGSIPEINFPDTIVFCYPEMITIESDNDFMEYLWGDNTTNAYINVNLSGIYTLNVIDFNGCKAIDSVYAHGDNCDAEPTPNIFTPNGDGFNDTFIIKAHGMEVLSIIILNRWGRIVGEVKDINEGWDGKGQNGDELPGGTYFYIAMAKYINQTTQELKGSLLLIRD